MDGCDEKNPDAFVIASPVAATGLAIPANSATAATPATLATVRQNRDGLVAAIGNTPLIRIASLSAATGCEIYGKAELVNPGGSVKDRVALRIVQEALESGQLKPGGLITEGSAGSTGVALSLVAAAFGCRCFVAMPDDAAVEKAEAMRALGAEVVRVRPVSITHPMHFVNVAKRRAEEESGKGRGMAGAKNGRSESSCSAVTNGTNATTASSATTTAATNTHATSSSRSSSITRDTDHTCCDGSISGTTITKRCVARISNDASCAASHLSSPGEEETAASGCGSGGHASSSGSSGRTASTGSVADAPESSSSSSGFFADQFENLANYRAHYFGTGPEIWRQTDGRVDAFVAAAGTGGTLAGVSCYLKEQNPAVKAFLIDPPGSSLFHKVTRGVLYTRQEAEGKRLRNPFDTITEGIGINRLTANFNVARIDGAFRGTDREAVEMARYLLRNDGLFVGSSSAMNCVGAVRVAEKMGPGHTIVTILCDSGFRHLSKFHNGQYLTGQGLSPTAQGLEFLGGRFAERK
ncbi:hypothetical protein CLOM_g3191 [Closterium sp. NIES-68]|nr:hypothetical protein CLOM_g3191 [Closterium sp. NIES-68]